MVKLVEHRIGERKPEPFDFLGFIHICSRTKQGYFSVMRQTARARKWARLKPSTLDCDATLKIPYSFLRGP